MQQRSPEWYAARCGRVTASRVAHVMARTKTGYSTTRANYLAELICERITGTVAVEDSYVNAAMQWGMDTEPQARMAYELAAGVDVAEIGFINHASIAMFGASPDGLIGDVGLVEIKCPNTATHIDTLLNGKIEGKYMTQMQSQMACTGRAWCDFVSFDPRMPADMQIWTLRVHRDDAAIAEIEKEVSAFLAELADKEHTLRSRYGIAA